MLELLTHAASLYQNLKNLTNTFADAHDEMNETSSAFQRATETVEFLRLKLPPELARPRVAIVCGSGLGGLAKVVDAEEREEWAYKDVPNFPVGSGEYGGT